MLRSALRASLLLAFAFTLPACDSGSDDPMTPPAPPAGTPPAVDPTGAFTAAAATPGQWAFVPTGGAKCRDGSDTGFGVRIQPGATDLMIYLEGGGACFDPATCSQNRSNFGAADFADAAQIRLNGGIFNTADSNPVGKWNQVYVPYCTGDVHGGTTAAGLVPGVAGAQQFVGHKNIEKYMGLIGPYFGTPNKVLLSGLSAGGFGSLLNFPTVDSTFSASRTFLLNDSGPIPFDDTVLSPTLGGALVGLFRIDRTVPMASGIATPDGLQNIYSFLANTYPESRFALLSHLEDETIRGFFGFDPATNTRFVISGDQFASALRGTRGVLPSQWGTYFASGGTHTFIASDGLYNGTSGGVSLNSYVGELVNGNVSNVEPSPVRPALASAPRSLVLAR